MEWYKKCPFRVSFSKDYPILFLKVYIQSTYSPSPKYLIVIRQSFHYTLHYIISKYWRAFKLRKESVWCVNLNKLKEQVKCDFTYVKYYLYQLVFFPFMFPVKIFLKECFFFYISVYEKIVWSFNIFNDNISRVLKHEHRYLTKVNHRIQDYQTTSYYTQTLHNLLFTEKFNKSIRLVQC